MGLFATVEAELQKLAEVKRQAQNPGGTAPVAKLAPVVSDAAAAIAKAQAQATPPPRGGFDAGGLPDIVASGGGWATIMKAESGDPSVRRLQRAHDDLYLATAAVQKRGESWSDAAVRVMKAAPEPYRSIIEKELGGLTAELQKAMAGSQSGLGAEWLQTFMTPDFAELVRLARRVPTLHSRFPMSTKNFERPQIVADLIAYKVPEATANPTNVVSFPISNLGTAKVLFSAVKMAVTAVVSDELTLDSVFPLIPRLRANVAVALAAGQETATINGSTQGTHPDDGVASNSAQALWQGYRASAQGNDFAATAATVDLGGANMTYDNLLQLVLLQGSFGAVPGEGALITSAQGLVALMRLRDAAGIQVLATAEKFGPDYLLRTGALGEIVGRKVYSSDFVKTTLNATPGVVPPVTPGTKTQIILVNTTAFEYGDLQEITVAQDPLPGLGQQLFVAIQRLDFKRVKPGQSASDRPVTIGRNVDAT